MQIHFLQADKEKPSESLQKVEPQGSTNWLVIR